MSEPQEPLTKSIQYAEEDGSVLVMLAGQWKLADGLVDSEAVKRRVDESGKLSVRVNGDRVGEWDSSLVTLLVELRNYCDSIGREFTVEQLPKGVEGLLSLSLGAPEVNEVQRQGRGFFARAGEFSIDFYEDVMAIMVFIGRSLLSIGRVMTGSAQVRWRDFWYIVQQVGVEALPIVALISFLVGFIMAFVGAVQLEKFGATIYVADLVGLAMVREMGAMMTGIIMCGRTGAAFAATIGSMKVSEELDALKTTGISVMDFVVLPRVIALSVMMPLLCIFSDFVGILGGFFVGVGVMDLSFSEYFNQTNNAIEMVDFWVGVTKGIVFGILVAVMGCLRGMQSGRSSSAVGVAATSAVVTGITSIIIADAIFAVIFNALGI